MSTEDVHVTVKMAAVWFGVAPSTVRGWIGRYHLAATSRRSARIKTYRLADLADADLHARTGTGPLAQP